MGSCLSKPRKRRERRSSSRSSSFCCAGVPEASRNNAPDYEAPVGRIAPPPIATGLQDGGAKGRQLNPPAGAILLDSFQWATASTPLVSSQLHHEAIGITTSSVMSESIARMAANSDRPTSLCSRITVGLTEDETVTQDRVLCRPSYKWVRKRQPSLAMGASVKRRGVVELSVEKCGAPTTCSSSNTSPRSSFQRPRTSFPATLKPSNSPDDMEFITSALDHPSEPVQVEGPRSEYQFTRSGGWNKITVQENGGKDGERSGRMWWKKDGEPICM